MTDNITMTYAGHDLSSLITIKKIRRTIGNARDINKQKAPEIGTNVTHIKTEGKIIEVDFSLASFDLASMRFVSPDEPSNIVFGNINKLREKLAGIFHQDSVAQLSFSDEPDRYYKALVEDSVELEAIQTWYDEATVKFYIPDGTAHSSTYKMVRDYRTEGDKLVFDVTNNGTVDAYPIINVKHNDENGYIGIVNRQSILEIGDKEVVDSETREKSVNVHDYRKEAIRQGFATAQKNVGRLNDGKQTLDKTLALKTEWGRTHIVLSNPESAAGSGNHAGSLTWTIPDGGSLYDYIWWRQIFWCGNANQLGFIKLSVSDENGDFLYGVETIKRASGLDTEYNFYVSNGNGGYVFKERWKFKATHEDKQNPFNQDRGWSDLKRVDDTITVYWWGSYHQRTYPELKGRKSAKVHMAIGAFGGRPMVTYAYIDEFLYRKDKVAYEYNVPNEYGRGTTVIANCENDTLLVDNIPKLNHIVNGSTFIRIPPGKSTLEFYFSSWINRKPTVSFSFEERWL